MGQFKRRKFKCTEGGSNKFWDIKLLKSYPGVETFYGKVGTVGTGNYKSFKYAGIYAAEKYYNKKIEEKIKKGYIEINPEKILTSKNERNI